MTERDKILWQQDIEHIRQLKQYIRDLKRQITTIELLHIETIKEMIELKEENRKLKQTIKEK